MSTNTNPDARAVIIDTDVDIDDWMAILYLLNHESVDVQAITVVGTGAAHLEPGTRNALDLLELAGQPDIPVAAGQAETLDHNGRAFPDAIRSQVDGLYGLSLPTNANSPVEQHAVEFLIQFLEQAERPVTFVAIGPLTNLGLLLRERPDLANAIERIFIMGGAVGVPGNVHDADAAYPNYVAEWNVFIDPVAASIVLESGVPVTLAPLDVTRDVPVTEDVYLRFAQHHGSPAANFIYQALGKDFAFLQTGNFYFWDPVAAVLLTDPDIGTRRSTQLRVDTGSDVTTSGQLLVGSGAEIDVYFDLVPASFYDRLLAGLAQAETYKREITFVLDGEATTLRDVDPQLLLIDYLHMIDKGGTKLVCGEGGCGACTVMLTSWDSDRETMVKRNINACLHLLCACDGVEITTTQGIGSVASELDETQYAIAANNGSQCGYCTPGFVMSMYTLRQNDPNPSPQQVEDNFDGHICRCTGYRPILEGFHRLAAGEAPVGPPEILLDPGYEPPQPKPFSLHNPPADFEPYMKAPQPLQFGIDGFNYLRPTTLGPALDAAAQNYGNAKYLVGNTMIGIVKTRARYDETPHNPSFLIDLTAIDDLTTTSVTEDGVTIGGAVTIARLVEVLEDAIASQPERSGGMAAFHEHLQVVANHQVRNVAGVGGNIWLAVNGGDDSDLFTVMGALGAEVVVADPANHGGVSVPLLDLKKDYDTNDPSGTLPKGAIYKTFTIPFDSPGDRVRTFKSRLREQNAFPLVNAAFRINLNGTTVNDARLVFNGIDGGYEASEAPFGINPFTVTVPSRTAQYLVGKPWTDSTLAAALDVLADELGQLGPADSTMTIDGVPFAYRLDVALDFFYKMFVSIAMDVEPGEVAVTIESAGTKYRRPISSGTQTYNDYPDELPVSGPYIKRSAFLQASGEAKYTHDMTTPPGTVEAAFVYSDILRGRFHYQLPVTSSYGDAGQRVTAAELSAFIADRFGGFVGYVTYSDIGVDQRRSNWMGIGADDPVFVPSLDDDLPESIQQAASSAENRNFFPDEITCIGAPLGVVVADDRQSAYDIATYIRTQCINFISADPSSIVTSLDEAVEREQFFVNYPTSNPGLTHIPSIERPGSDETWLDGSQPLGGDTSLHEVSGRQENGYQNHFYLETIGALAEPTENGAMTIYASTQTLADNQTNAADILGVPLNKVRVIVRRDGGGFGGKQTRSRFASTAAALAAKVMNRPVRLVNDLNTNFIMCGERHPFLGNYRLAVDDSAKIRGLDLDIYSNGGCTYDVSFPVMDLAVMSIDNCYQIDTYRVAGKVAQTNRISNTAFRSFGVVQAMNIVETAIEHAAHELGVAPEVIRQTNLYRNGQVDWEGFEITRQTLAVMETYGLSPDQVEGLEALVGQEFDDQAAFEQAVAGAIGDVPLETLRLLEDYATTAHDFAPYLQPMQYCDIRNVWDALTESSEFETRAAQVAAFNEQNRWRKRGISMMPLKYGISYTGPRGTLDQGGALVTTYAGGGFGDGSVLVQHGGVEIGQGIQTKMAQIGAQTLGIPLELVLMADTDTNVITDASPTAASTGSDLNGGAVHEACKKLRTRLEDFCQDLEQYQSYYLQFDDEKMDAETKVMVQAVVNNWRERWSEVWPLIVRLAYINRIDLAAEARYKTPHYSAVDIAHPFGRPFFYFTYAAAASEVEIDVLTGEWTILRSDILFDVGKSLNPLIDIGQIEGGFVQGVGYLTTEEMLYQDPGEAPKDGYPDGALLSYGTWLYKPPETKTIPVDFRVGLVDNEGKTVEHKGHRLDPSAVKSSKGIGEPPLVMGNSVFFAIRQAVAAARRDAGRPEWFDFPAPATVPRIQQACAVSRDQLTLDGGRSAADPTAEHKGAFAAAIEASPNMRRMAP